MTTDEMNLSELTNALTLTMAKLEAAVKRLQAARAKTKTAAPKSRKATPPKKQKSGLADVLSEKQRADLDSTLELLKRYRGAQ